PVALRPSVSRVGEAAALALALCSLLLGLVHWEAYLPITADGLSNPLTLKALSTAFWPILGGGLLAIFLGRWGHRPERAPFGETDVAMVAPARRAELQIGTLIDEFDGMLRRWP